MTGNNTLLFSINPIEAAVVGTVGGVVAYRKLGGSKRFDRRGIGLVCNLSYDHRLSL